MKLTQSLSFPLKTIHNNTEVVDSHGDLVLLAADDSVNLELIVAKLNQLAEEETTAEPETKYLVVTKYLMVNRVRKVFKVTTQSVTESGWTCSGKFKDGTRNDLQTLDNYKYDLRQEGYIELDN